MNTNHLVRRLTLEPRFSATPLTPGALRFSRLISCITFRPALLMPLALALFGLQSSLCTTSAATLFWDANGAAGCGGAGNWGSGAVQGNFWGTGCDTGLGILWNNANPDSAVFSGTAGAVTITNTGITVNKITVQTTGYSIIGSPALTFSGAGAGVDFSSAVNPNNFTLSCPYAGSLLTKTGTGRLTLNNAGSTVSKFLIQGGEISSAAISRFGDGSFGPGRP
jgi:hypothetical protein